MARRPPAQQQKPLNPEYTLQEDLAVLEDYIRELWKFLPTPTCYVNPVHHILDANSALFQMVGYTNTELIGSDAEVLFGNTKATQKLLKEVLEQDSLVRETHLHTKKGEKIPVRLYSQRRMDPEAGIVGYFLGLVDITREKQFLKELEARVQERTKELEDTRSALVNMLEDTEEARKAAEEERNRIQIIISNFADGLFVFREGALDIINPEAEKLFDVKARDLVGKTPEQLVLFPTIKPVMEVMLAQKKLFRYEVQLQGEVAVEVTTSTAQSETGERETIVLLHNITREKQIEKMKTEFVSLAAHQLRTPLSAIKWTVQMILDEEAGEIQEQQREMLMKTYESNERMITLINDLLDVTRIEEGRYLFKPVFVEMEDVLAEAVKRHQDEAKRKGLKIVYDKPKKELPRTLVDEEKIQLVLQNLIENAIRYTSKGGTITVGIEFQEEKNMLVVTVKDTGIGIPKAQQGRVFEKFFRATNAKLFETEGSGLGLYLVRNIVSAHEGEVWFESEEGKGTTFAFSLPAKKEIEEFLKKF